jgi:hypothetical protein
LTYVGPATEKDTYYRALVRAVPFINPLHSVRIRMKDAANLLRRSRKGRKNLLRMWINELANTNLHVGGVYGNLPPEARRMLAGMGMHQKHLNAGLQALRELARQEFPLGWLLKP